MDAKDIIDFLGLSPLPLEGGYYRETYRSPEQIAHYALPARYSEGKHFSTAIYYLVTPDTVSRLHRLPSDEVYHYYLGDPYEMLVLHPDGSAETVILGKEILKGQRLQYTVRAGCFQGGCLLEGGRFALMGTTVSPAFDFKDFESGNRTLLLDEYPEHRELILKLTF